MIEDDVKECVEVMKKGGLILYPTDTIWGIGCDATNAEAVKKVYELKQRADNKALIVLLDSVGRRSPHEEFSNRLCECFGKPVVSTSANISGGATAHFFDEIDSKIKEGVDYVVKYRQDDKKPHEASNIIMLKEDGSFKILR